MNPLEYAKAITGLLVPLIVFLLMKVGFNADPSFVGLLTIILTPILVYLIPNKPVAVVAVTKVKAKS